MKNRIVATSSMIVFLLASFVSQGLAQDLGKLVSDLNNPDAQVRADAAAAIGEMGPGARSAVPALAEALKDADSYVRYFAATALSEVGKDALPALNALIMAMRDPDASVNGAAQMAIGNIGPAAAKTIPLLIKSLVAWQSAAQESPAAYALVQMGEAAVPAIAEMMMTARDKRVILAGVWCLTKIKSTSKKALVALTQSLRHFDPNIADLSSAALRARGKIAIPIFVKGLSDGDPYVRKQCAWALGKMGTMAGSVLPTLETMVKKDRNPNVKQAAKWAINRIKGKPEAE